MRRYAGALFIISFVLIALWSFYYRERGILVDTTKSTITTMALSITSTEFKMDGTIPKRFTCDGENISPKLIFAGIPVGTKSLALTMEDPDVPGSVLTHRIFDHWLVWNISPTAAGIEEGSTDAGTIGTNSAGRISYTGPCPPDREHRYIFTLYALDSLLDLPQGASKQKLLNGLSSHLLGKTVLVGKYNRK